MAIGFFGGDDRFAHFSCTPSYKVYGLDGKARREVHAKLKAAFPGREKYFQFAVKMRNGRPNNLGKLNARKACERYAAEVTATTGIVMEINEGFFL